MSDQLRDLLEQVANGDLAPEDAARTLDGTEPPPRPARVEIRVDAVHLQVVADPGVDVVAVDGPLEVVRRDDVLVLQAPGAAEGSYRFGPVGGVLSAWLAGRDQARCRVRINPDLPLSIDTSASRLDLTGLRAGLTVRQSAGALRMTRCEGPVDVEVISGSARIELLATHGRSTVKGQMSHLHLQLMRGSDVAVTTNAELGSTKVTGVSTAAAAAREWAGTTVGLGTATLDVSMQMGSIKVVLP